MKPEDYAQGASDAFGPILVTCPSCNQPGFLDAWDWIESTWDEPHELLASGQLFKYQCPVCGTETTMGYTCVYHDSNRKAFLIYIPDPDKLEDGRKAVDQLAVGFEEVQGLAPHTYMRRLVGTAFEFCEKVRLLDEGYDDRVIELMKLAIKRGMVEEGIIGPADRLIYERTMPDGQISFVVTGDVPGDVVGKKEGYDYLAKLLAEREAEDPGALAGEYRFDSAWAHAFLP